MADRQLQNKNLNSSQQQPIQDRKKMQEEIDEEGETMKLETRIKRRIPAERKESTGICYQSSSVHRNHALIGNALPSALSLHTN